MGAGGGGLISDGTSNYNDPQNILHMFGKSFINNGNGGYKINKYYNEGSFGGGSSGYISTSGGGGGYTGGHGFSIGIGGSSYSLTTINKEGYNNKDGYVIIKYISI
jgi:hypothetical protein